MSGHARLRVFQTRTVVLRRLLALVAILAISSGVVVLDAAADLSDDVADRLTVLPHHLLASSEQAVEHGLAGSLGATLAVPAGRSAIGTPGGVDDAANHRGEAPAGEPGVWDRLAECESNGRWHLDTGNGYYGGLQFKLSSWRAVGGTGYPHEHPREVQVEKAERLLDVQGWQAWPECSRRLGFSR